MGSMWNISWCTETREIPRSDKNVDIAAHHLIGHSEGKMGSKAHDLFTMPLHVDEYRNFHDDPTGWESMNGSQLYYVKQTIKKALDIGVLVIE
ncbi:DUF968 domain-containing protein [Vibrio sp. CAIM 722]|uniref:DUF968 domain-containing protein n=3 Tax=Vibrio TaxID=662 RepID=A0A7X4RVZ1_9VIBR|nr:DUF968 domain-containing protein [Vibrio eleionomae]MBF9000695.1 DUF968 domain-containing protein [Vibrio nitrifigilis]MZI94810.1 DUF968 domain-containing protein [Vibrio eleionomae]